MRTILRILNGLPFFWILLAVPAILMLHGYFSGAVIAMDMLHPTGEMSARLMILALMLSPLIAIFGKKGWTNWLLRRRRSMGVAAFGYAMLHTVFYIIDMETLKPILAEFWAPGIWTGWAAMLIFIPMALTSNNAAMRWLGRNWKRLQRLVYAAALLTLAHWALVHDGVSGALVHFIPLAALQLLRMIINYAKGSRTLRHIDSNSPQQE